VIASLATYFGERPLEIVLFDADEERLDLFDRFARLCFAMMKSTHTLRATSEFEEAVEDVDRAILQMGEYCFAKTLPKAENRSRWLGDRLSHLSIEFQALDLEELALDLPIPVAIAREWPAPSESEFPYRVPLQILRWLNGEEYPFDVFREHEKSPLKLWLDDPHALSMRMPATSVTF
jgi:hypothetical protein